MAKRTKRVRKRRFKTPEVCYFCDNKKIPTYKKVDELQNFVTNRAKIFGRSRSGLCSKHQRRLALNVKRARHLGFIPFAIKV